MQARIGHVLKSLSALLDGGQRLRLTLLVFAGFVAAVLEMIGIGAIPALVALWADPMRLLGALPEWPVTEMLRSADNDRLILLSACLLVVLVIVKNAFLVGLLQAEGRVLRDLSASLSIRLFRSYLLHPYTFHLSRNPADLIRNTVAEVPEAVQFVRSCMAVLREGLVLGVVLLLLLLIDPLVSLVVFSLLGTAATVLYVSVRKAMSRHGESAQMHRGAQLKAVQQGLGGIKIARLLGREEHLIRTFGAETEAVEGHDMFHRVVIGLPRLFLEVVAVTAVLLVAGAFIALGRPTQTMLPVLALLAVAIVRLVPALNAITAALSLMRYHGAAVRLISGELQAVETATVSRLDDSHAPVDMSSSIVLHDVSYRYPAAGVAAVRGVSLEIRAGEAVGVIGASGAGKSTLIDVILGLLEPTEGKVGVDGRNVHESLRAWQRQIGYVPQEIYLIDDTIRRNIGFGLPDSGIDDESVMRAATAARLDGFVQALPDGLETVVGDRGIRLSGGQRQRIGIARALYHNPRVLVLDEATSSLDDETEGEVIDAIARLRGDRTLIIVAHRLTTVADCDRIYLLEDGQIIDQGDLPDLVGRHGKLRAGALQNTGLRDSAARQVIRASSGNGNHDDA
jgi:ATP-binding cassette, subfamily B, bacterial PglK